MADLQKFAEEKKKQLSYISMGQGTGPKALSLIRDCMTTGGWALL
jgi:dynein heavy chain, axonemal